MTSGKGGLAYREAVGQALCFGRDRRAHEVDRERVGELSEEGLMHPAGLKKFQNRDRSKAGLYLFEKPTRFLNKNQGELFNTNKAAWEFFQVEPPGYERNAIWWVTSAKREETRQRRLQTLI